MPNTFQESACRTENIFQESLSSSELRIDTDALLANYFRIKALASFSQVAPVLKADAYGLGIENIAPLLWSNGARHFFVATTAEGVALRSLLPLATIYLLNGFMKGEENTLLTHNLIPVVPSYEMAQTLSLFSKKKEIPVKIALQFNTGLNRLGLKQYEAQHFLKGGIFTPFLEVVHILSHFASSSIVTHPQNMLQEKAFSHVAKLFPNQPKSLSSSAALAFDHSAFYDIVRVGISLYGICPGQKIEGFQFVTTLRAPILQVFEASSGECVGYDGTHTLKRDSRLATIELGYADGYPPSLANKGYVCIEHYKAPIIGKISMDLMTVDVTDIPETLLYPEMPCVLWGKDPTIEEISSLSQLIPNALLTGLGHRVKRVIKK